MENEKKQIENENEIAQAHFDAMVEKECQEMGFKSFEEYEYYLKTRGE
jgi:hypothetical protein